MTPPQTDVARIRESRDDDPLAIRLDEHAPLAPFRAMDPARALTCQTTVRLGWDERFLHLAAWCEDDFAWGTFTERDDPIWQEEAFELFVGEDVDPLQSYFEIDISPRGTLFDARVRSPHGDRRGMQVDAGWNCPGLHSRVARAPTRQDWLVRFAIPWHAFGFASAPCSLRANFYRIDRAHGREAEFSGWSPTLTRPADFHRPARFGLLRMIE